MESELKKYAICPTADLTCCPRREATVSKQQFVLFVFRPLPSDSRPKCCPSCHLTQAWRSPLNPHVVWDNTNNAQICDTWQTTRENTSWCVVWNTWHVGIPVTSRIPFRSRRIKEEEEEEKEEKEDTREMQWLFTWKPCTQGSHWSQRGRGRERREGRKDVWKHWYVSWSVYLWWLEMQHQSCGCRAVRGLAWIPNPVPHRWRVHVAGHWAAGAGNSW